MLMHSGHSRHFRKIDYKIGRDEIDYKIGRDEKDSRTLISILGIPAIIELYAKEKLKSVKARLNFEETSHHSEPGTPIRRRGLKERLGPRYVRSRSGSPESRCGRPESPKKKGSDRNAVFKRLEKGVFHRLGDKGKSVSIYSDDSRRRSYHSSHRDTESCHQSSRSRTTENASERRYNKKASSKRTEELSQSEGSAGDPFTHRICYFDFPKTIMPSHIKTYDGSEDLEDHLKIFQSVAKTERWAMPTWYHMFNSTLTGNARVWFDDLPKETIDSYDDLKKAFLENYLQQKNALKTRDVKGAPECMKISGFMHGITNPELIKRLHDKIPKSVDEMMREANQKQNFKKGGFRNQQRSKRKQDRFALLTKTPKEIFALDKGKFKAPSPMTTTVEKRNANKFCEFHGEGGHNTDESIGDEEHSASALMNFVVVRSPSPYNGIIGRPGVRKLQAVPSTVHGMLKIPVEGGRINGGRKDKSGDQPRIPGIDYNDRINSHKRRSQQVVQPAPTKLGYFRLEACGHDWHPKAHRGAPFKCAEGMLSDFKDLNKACPKDGYPLPEIDWKVESLCGFPFKCFLDAYKGYHQIQMIKEDEEKTTFIRSQGIFCYTKMPFGLRNAGATYQRLVDKTFHKQIGRNLEVYVDDLVIKSRTEDEIVKDMEETFQTLREINMKLNPKKCTFGIEKGMLLGYKVSTRGLKVCPDKVDAVLSLPSPRTLRGPEVNYTSMEKLVLALVHASKHLKRPKVSIKGQILADFIVERPEEESLDTLMGEEEELPKPWILFTDESSCTDGSGAGLILTNPEGMEFTYALRFRFNATNNEAEYEALIAGLKIAELMGVKNLQANVDSRLVANQVNGTYVAKETNMVRYLEKVKTLTSSFKAFSIKQVPRSENKKADALSKITSTSFAHLSKQVLVEELKERSISTVEVLAVVEEEGDTWMTPIFKYLMDGTLPIEVKKARAVKRKSLHFSIINGTLYKKIFLRTMAAMRRTTPSQLCPKRDIRGVL
ncbi:reverse transcriptase domain-containing protein [Tanacetum coccineum]